MPFQDLTTTILPVQDHKTVHSIKDLKNVSIFNKIGNMPGKYSITLDPDILRVQHGRARKEKVDDSTRYHYPTGGAYTLDEFTYISLQG